MQKLFPTLLIILDVCAAAAYMPSGDWRKVVCRSSGPRHSSGSRTAA